jgi:hypothetical protein
MSATRFLYPHSFFCLIIKRKYFSCVFKTFLRNPNIGLKILKFFRIYFLEKSPRKTDMYVGLYNDAIVRTSTELHIFYQCPRNNWF